MRKNKILGGIAVLAIATVAAFNVNFNSQKNTLHGVALANVEALANEQDGITWQIGTKVLKTTESPGWSWDASLSLWKLNGKVTRSYPPSSKEVTLKCCRRQGDLWECSFESC